MIRRRGSFSAVSLAAMVVLVLSAVTACSGGSSASGDASGGSSASDGSTGTAALTGTVTVFAAASLKATFTALGTEFEKEHPGTTVRLSFAGSSDLVTQITQGAPADVFASADTANMDKLSKAGLVQGTPRNFATNVLEIAVPPANPAGIHSFADLARPGAKVVVCAPQVPCGAATKKVEDATGTTLSPVSEESSVTDVLGKVLAGEADAGLVYATDVKDAGAKVTGIPFAASAKAVNTYPIAVVNTTARGDLAAAFLDLVTSAKGRDTLTAAGFGAP